MSLHACWKDLQKIYEKYAHGATLCEIRHDIQQYTLVPETKYHTTNEPIEWEHFEGIHEYTGDLQMDVGKLALSTACCFAKSLSCSFRETAAGLPPPNELRNVPRLATASGL